MNILVINWQDWNNPNAGGAEVHLHEIFVRLIKNGHSVYVICSRGCKQTRYSQQDGFRIYRIGRRYNFNFFVPGIIHRFIDVHDIDVICDDLNKIPFYSPWFVKRPVVALVHHLFRKTIFQETNAVFALYVYGAESIIPLCYRNTPFIAVSESSAQDLVDMGISRSKIHIVHNGIPVHVPSRGVDRVKDLVVYVGRIKRYKSIDHFLQAVSLVQAKRSVKIMVVGEGDALESLKTIARRMELDVQFTGFVSEEEKFMIYSQARVAVQPSVKEGWGLTAIEAQSCGTPVVCADSPGLREAVVHGKTGFLYPYGNIEQCAEKLQILLDDDHQWERCSREARSWAGKFSWDSAAGKIEHILRNVVERNGYE